MVNFLKTLIVSNSANQGYGSLRWALEKVEMSDCSKIRIDPSVVRIQLDYSLPSIACDLEIEGCGVVIDGANRCQIMQVKSGRVIVSNFGWCVFCVKKLF